MNANPKISIVVPVYNTEPYLRECLDSITGQTLKDIEIIVINDGSPDRSIDIIREYEKKDSRIVVIDKPNEGVGKARNDGIDRAKGEFIAFMDSDDYYPESSTLQKLYSAAKDKNVKAAGGKHQRLQESGILADRNADKEMYGMPFKKSLCKYSEYQYDSDYWTFLYDRKVIQENHIRFPSYSRFQDPPFFVRAMARIEDFTYIDEPVYIYRETAMPTKYSIAKTLDMMKGLADNLVFSRKNNLAKLHCLTAHRLGREASFMITKNLNDSRYTQLLSAYLKTLALIDFDWLKAEGYPLPEPFVPEVFTYMRDAAMKYEKIRRNKLVRMFAKLKK